MQKNQMRFQKNQMRFNVMPVGPLAANCIVVWDPVLKDGMVIDPGGEPETIMDFIEKEGISVKLIICTHAHFDHVGAVPEIKEKTGAFVAVHKDELGLYEGVADQAALWGYSLEPLPPADRLLEDGDYLEAGQIRFKVIHAPGHSPGGICLYREGVVITGDTLFLGSIGRTDFYGGDHALIMKSLAKLAALPPKTVVLPGHGPSSTIGNELENNPFYQDIDL